MVTRPPNRAPSAPRFQRAVTAIGDIGTSGPSFASIGAQGGPVDVGMAALDRIGQALIDQDINDQAKRVTEEAKAAGLSEAEHAYKKGELVKLREDETLAAEAYNRSIQSAYFEQLDLDWSRRFGELEREHGTDADAFSHAVDEEAHKVKQLMPQQWHSHVDSYIGKKKNAGVDRITRTTLKTAADEANATHLETINTNLAEMSDALRDAGMLEGSAVDEAMARAQEAQAKVLEANRNRTDLSPQAKAKNAIELEKLWRRQSIIGEFEGALERSPEDAQALIEAISAGDTIKDPDERAKVVGEMSAKLRDAVNVRTTAEKQQAAQRKADNAQAISNLEIRVNRGEAGHTELAAADEAGLFEFDPKARTRIFKAADKKHEDLQKEADRVALGAALFSGEAVTFANDKERQKAVDAYYQNNIAPPLMNANASAEDVTKAVVDYTIATKVMPTRAREALRAKLSSGTPSIVAFASSNIAQIQAREPSALEGFGDKYVSRALLVDKLVDVGVPPEDAVARADKILEPVNKDVREARMAEITQAKYAKQYGTWITDHFNRTTFNDFVPWGASDDVGTSKADDTDVRIVSDFKTVFEDWYIRNGGDADHAKAMAFMDLDRAWGASAVDGDLRAFKYPPEKFYGANTDGSAKEGTDADGERLQGMLLDALHDAGLPRHIGIDRVTVRSDAITADEAASGKPTYEIQVIDKNGIPGPFTIEGMPARWSPERGLFKSEYRPRASNVRASIDQIDAATQAQIGMILEEAGLQVSASNIEGVASAYREGNNRAWEWLKENGGQNIEGMLARRGYVTKQMDKNGVAGWDRKGPRY